MVHVSKVGLNIGENVGEIVGVTPTDREMEYFLAFKAEGKLEQFLMDLQLGASMGTAIQKIGISYKTLKKWCGFEGPEWDELRGKMRGAIADCAVVCEQTMALRSQHAWLTQGPGKYLEGNPWVEQEDTTNTNEVADTMSNQPTQEDMMIALQEARKLGISIDALIDQGASLSVDDTPDSSAMMRPALEQVGDRDPSSSNGSHIDGGSNTLTPSNTHAVNGSHISEPLLNGSHTQQVPFDAGSHNTNEPFPSSTHQTIDPSTETHKTYDPSVNPKSDKFIDKLFYKNVDCPLDKLINKYKVKGESKDAGLLNEDPEISTGSPSERAVLNPSQEKFLEGVLKDG